MNEIIDAPSGASEVVRLDQMTDTQRNSFLKTGEVPTNAPAKETSSETVAVPEGEKPTGESGAASDTANKELNSQEPQPRKSRYDRRIDRLTAEKKALEAELEKARTTKPTEQAKAAESTAAKDLEKRPRAKDFPTIEAWEDAVEVYDEKQRKTAVAEALRLEREGQKQAETQTEQQKQIDKLSDTFAKRAKDFRKTLPVDSFPEDFTEVNAFINEAGVFHLADALVESEVGPALMHYFNSSDAAFGELEAIAKMSPAGALMALGRLASSDKIKVPASPTVTRSRSIGESKVNGTGSSVSEDAQLEEAVQKRDMAAFMKAEDKREGRPSRRGAW